MSSARLLSLFLAVTTTSAASLADTIHVDDDNCPGGTGSAADPFCSVQDAIDLATSGDEIIVAQGTYVEELDLLGKAITLRSTNPQHAGTVAATILDSTGAPYTLRCDSGEGADTIVSGLTITGGDEAAMLLDGSGPDISRCNFTAGTGSFSGGIQATGGSSPVISSCQFIDCTSFNTGALTLEQSSALVTQCTFSGNTGLGDGGIASIKSNLVISDCSFTGNNGEGAGAILFLAGTAEIRDCTFRENSTFGLGDSPRGAGAVLISFADVTLERCSFDNNTGPGVYNEFLSNVSLTNCEFIGNVALAQPGGGIYNEESTVDLVNCSFVGNTNPEFGGAGGAMGSVSSTVTAANCIFWDNYPDQIFGGASVTFSDVQGGYPGAGNVDVDPRFRSAADTRLAFDSPCIDAGNNAALAAGVTTDLAGQPRLLDNPDVADTGSGSSPLVDLGAHEFDRQLGGLNYCVAYPNSVSLDGAVMGATGAFSVQSNDVVISASNVPNSFGIFFYGSSTNFVAPFGNGVLCVKAPITRLNPGGFASSNTASKSLDIGPGGAHEAITPGDPWYFQYWYRDTGQGSGFNTSDALECHFGVLD